jgi:hypothetical protein
VNEVVAARVSLPRIMDELVERHLRAHDRRLDAVLGAPATPEELAAEEAGEHLDEAFYETREIWDFKK